MVRSKDVPKKPRDPLLTPPSKLRGAGFLDETGRPSNRGGAAMSPAPASVPNYMRGTSSSDAKGGLRRARLSATAAPASASPARRRTAAPAVRVVTKGKVLFPEAPAPAPGSGSGSGPGLGRATCSSTLKGAKFPDALDLAPGATHAEGPAAMRVCPYTYCSLNGHAHTPAVPLRSFLASRRRLIRTQQSMKLKGVSAFRKKSGDKNGASVGAVVPAAKIAPLIDDDAIGDFFVEVYAGPRLSTGSDMSLDEVDATVRKMEFLVFDRCGADEDSDKLTDPADGGCGERDGSLEKDGADRDSNSMCSDAVISGNFIEELPWMRYHGSEYDSLEDGISEEQRMRDDEIDRAQISEEQGGNSNEGISDKLGDECQQEATEEHGENDEENIPNSVVEPEIAGEQEGFACRVEACQDLDTRDEDNILDALCDGESCAGQATVEEKFSDHVHKSEIPDGEVAGRADSSILEESCIEETSADQAEKEGESSVKSDGGSEVTSDDGILDALCDEKSCAGQATVEEMFSDHVHKSEIPDQEVAGREDSSILEESCIEEISADQAEKEDESSVKSNGGSEVTSNDGILDALCDGESCAGQATVEEMFSDHVHKSEIPDREVAGREDSSILEESCIEEISADQVEKGDESSVKSSGGSEVTSDDGSEMEISEDTIFNDGCREDFLEEIASKVVSAEDMFEQYYSIIAENTANDVFQQDGSPENDQSNVQKESGIVMSEIENSSEGFDIVHNIMDSMKDAQKEMEVTTYRLGESCKESGTAPGSNPDSISTCFDDGSQMEPKVSTCMPEDASVESDVSQGSNLDGNTEYVVDGTEMGPEITRCKVEDSYEEHGIDQGTVEDDDSVCVKDDAQNDDSEMTECRLRDASKNSSTTGESEQSGSLPNVRSSAQNESNHTTSELALGISEDTENESNLTTCQPGVSEESCIGQDSDHDVDSDVVKEHESKGNISDSQKNVESTVCESGAASERSAMSQEADSAQKGITLLKLDVYEDIQTAEETNESFNVEIPDPKYDWTVEGYVEPQNITAEVPNAKEPSIDDICDAFSGMNLKGDLYFDPDEFATCPRNKLIISRRRRTPEEEEYLRGFNPRAPNFLPLELDPDAEKVDLRHQMVDERRNAEEWMIDYALRRAVTNLAPARKKKVELLVQAFETVLPHDEDDKKSMTPPRPVQDCN